MPPTDATELRTLVEECKNLNQCEDCGTFVVDPNTHCCSSEADRTGTNRSARQERAARDTRDDADAVGIFRRSTGHTYAYHELDGDEVCCGCGEYTKATRFDIVTRGEAKSLGRCPCGNCARLRSLRSGDD
jgi:hypothetical protein